MASQACWGSGYGEQQRNPKLALTSCRETVFAVQLAPLAVLQIEPPYSAHCPVAPG